LTNGAPISVPILVNHDPSKSIGSSSIVDGRVRIRLFKPMARNTLFNVFGNVCIRIFDAKVEDDDIMVTEFEIMEWSVSPEDCTTTPTETTAE
jgi:hypothetical protein